MAALRISARDFRFARANASAFYPGEPANLEPELTLRLFCFYRAINSWRILALKHSFAITIRDSLNQVVQAAT